MIENLLAPLSRALMGLISGIAVFLVLAGAAMAEEVPLQVDSADVGTDPYTGQPVIMIELSETGRKAFADFTIRHEGTQIDVVLDGKVLTSPFIRSPITGGSLMISGDFTTEEVEAMAMRIITVEGVFHVRSPAQ